MLLLDRPAGLLVKDRSKAANPEVSRPGTEAAQRSDPEGELGSEL